ncbi:hypothetical protein F5Y09DRAFT_324728 [Xylaria sp. FL1042]|nr:hypothetical protein F5Y09DRAFT_324728 [Xylaria sp. FL1042]
MGIKRRFSLVTRSNEELFTSGLFSDVTVKCGDKTWNLHRNILSARCEYFRVALQVNASKESPGRSIKIRDLDPVHVNWVIFFIYTEKASGDLSTLLETDETTLQTTLDLFTIANFFNLDELCTCAIDILKMKLCNSTDNLRVDSNYPTRRNEVKEKAFFTSFTDIVRAAYSNGSDSFKRLKEALILYASVSGNVPFQEQFMGNSFFTDPSLAGFALDVFRDLVNNQRARSGHLCRPYSGVPQKVEGLCKVCIPILGKEALESLCGSRQNVQ